MWILTIKREKLVKNMNAEEFDDLDIGILRELRINCKMPMRRLAEKLKSHPNTIMQRIKILEKKGVITGYKATIDYKKAGYDCNVIVLIKITKESRRDWKLLENLRHFSEIRNVYAITGEHDLMVIAQTKSNDDLRELLKKIDKLPFVERTETHSILDEIKSGYEFNPLENYPNTR